MKIEGETILATYGELKEMGLKALTGLYSRKLMGDARKSGSATETFEAVPLRLYNKEVAEANKKSMKRKTTEEQKAEQIIALLQGLEVEEQEEVGDSSEEVEEQEEGLSESEWEIHYPDVVFTYSGTGECQVELVFEFYEESDLVHVVNLLEEHRQFHWVNGDAIHLNLKYDWGKVASYLDGNYEVHEAPAGGLSYFMNLNYARVRESVRIFIKYDEILSQNGAQWDRVSSIAKIGRKAMKRNTEHFFQFLEEVWYFRRLAREDGDYKDPVRRAILQSTEWELQLENYHSKQRKYISVTFTPKDYRDVISPAGDTPSDKGYRKNMKFFNPVLGDTRSTEASYADRCFEDKAERNKSQWW